MKGSRKIRVIKRDGSVEEFDTARLACALWRGMRGTDGSFEDAHQLAWAIELYVRRRRWKMVSTSAVFEMALKVLRRVRLGAAAENLERHRARRAARRILLKIEHPCGRRTAWDKGWVCQMACRWWHVSRATGRTLAGRIERELLGGSRTRVTRREVAERLNALVGEYGLADAVPVVQSAR